MKIVLAIVVLAAAGGGYFGWRQHQDLMQTKSDLAATKTALAKASADANAAKADAAAARKEVEDQKAALQQARIDAEVAGKFLEMEKVHSARLQQELTLAREQMAYMRARGAAAGGRIPPEMVPMIVQPRIEAIRIAPSAVQQQRAIGAASPAKPPASQ